MESDVREANLLVVGCGPIGLFAVAAASALGAARISAIDPVSFRSNLAQSVGAHITASSINELDGGLCGVGDADIVIESSGHPGAIRSALEAIRPGGEFIIAGLPDEEISVDISRHIVLREVHLRGIYGRLIDETWITVERFLQQNAVRIDPILTHEFPLEAFEAAFSAAASGRVGKVLFEIAG